VNPAFDCTRWTTASCAGDVLAARVADGVRTLCFPERTTNGVTVCDQPSTACGGQRGCTVTFTVSNEFRTQGPNTYGFTGHVGSLTGTMRGEYGPITCTFTPTLDPPMPFTVTYSGFVRSGCSESVDVNTMVIDDWSYLRLDSSNSLCDAVASLLRSALADAVQSEFRQELSAPPCAACSHAACPTSAVCQDSP
jgi:hypothetical protein